MGTYIKKALGYGITIPEEKKVQLLNEEAVENIFSLTPEGYKKFLQTKYAGQVHSQDELMSDIHVVKAGDNKPQQIWSSLTIVGPDEYGAENGDTHVVIIPYSVCKEWQHFDDAIDYYEEAYTHRNDESMNMEPSIKFFNHGLFPYDGRFINTRTGAIVKSAVYRDLLSMESLLRNATEKASLKYVSTAFRKLGVENWEELHSVISPAPPICAIDLAEYSGLFKDSDTIKNLRPALLTYWS